VTCDDFRQALSDANKVDLTQFERWYTQPGTPLVRVTDRSYDPDEGSFSFTLSQSWRDAVDGTKAQPFHIPFLVGMLDGETGSQILDSTLLELTQPSQTFSLQLPKGLSSVVPSFLRNFSAPVKLQIEPPLNTEDLSFLMQHDTDAYNRWDAAQSLVMRTLFDSYVGGDQSLVEVEKAMKAVLLLSIEKKDWRFLASVLLALPSLNEFCQLLSIFCQALSIPVDPVLATQSRRKVKHRLAQALRSELLLCLKATEAGSQTDFSISPEEQGRRALHNLCLDYLAPLEGGSSLALEHYKAATCMTDKLGALTAIIPLNTEDSEFALHDFKTHAVDALVVDKWFTVQASVCSVARIRDLLAHEEFSWSNPNRIRSVLSAFSSSNLEHFHSESGEGYELVGNAVLKLDTTNHRVSASLARCFSSWPVYNETRQTLMKAQLTRFVSKEGVSKELFEVASKCLNN
jgi:aminopeptidase N